MLNATGEILGVILTTIWLYYRMWEQLDREKMFDELSPQFHRRRNRNPKPKAFHRRWWGKLIKHFRRKAANPYRRYNQNVRDNVKYLMH